MVFVASCVSQSHSNKHAETDSLGSRAFAKHPKQPHFWRQRNLVFVYERCGVDPSCDWGNLLRFELPSIDISTGVLLVVKKLANDVSRLNQHQLPVGHRIVVASEDKFGLSSEFEPTISGY